MIKPVSNTSLSIEPIKVPHQNVSFNGLGSTLKKVTTKIAGEDFAGKAADKARPLYVKAKNLTGKIAGKVTEYAKKMPEYFKKAADFISETFDKVKKFVVTKFGDLRDVTKNSGRKARMAAIGTVAGIGAVGGTATAVKIGRKNKSK